MGVAPVITEKDFWVCWVLAHLFAVPDSVPGLVFKGGTSLSKVYRVISRFSEDVDLLLDRRDLGFGDDRDPGQAGSRKKADALIDELVAATVRHIDDVLRPRLASVFESSLGPQGEPWSLVVADDDPQTLDFHYPPSLPESNYGGVGYIRRKVRLELGAKGDQWPSERRTITPYAAEHFPDLFARAECEVSALTAERTFWEKATLLHAEHHRPLDKLAPEHGSRHYYDIVMLGRSAHGEKAIGDIDLLRSVVAHKSVFFRQGWASYETAVPGTMKLLPADDRRQELEADYRDMRLMFFDDPPRFSDLIDEVADLERRINAAR